MPHKLFNHIVDVLYERNEGLKLYVIYMKKDIETCLLFLHSQRWDIVTLHFILFVIHWCTNDCRASDWVIDDFEDLGDGLNARGFSWLCGQIRDVLFLEPNEIGGVAKWKVPLTCT